MDKTQLEAICRLVRYDILTATTRAGSGHPTSSLSAVELMTVLFFGGFLKYDTESQGNLINDRVIFSKGHAAPLLYSLYHAAGVINREELLSLRQEGSQLEGHPTPSFPFVDVATGSLGQGLSAGSGMAFGLHLAMDEGELNVARLPKVWVLLGDSEMAEGQIWEALNTAAFYKLNNLVAILDVNRLGQRGETMFGWNLTEYENRARACGWETIVLQNGHDPEEIAAAYKAVEEKTAAGGKPFMVIAKTIKGKGVSFLEDKEGWHGRALSNEELNAALKELGDINTALTGKIARPVTGKASEKALAQINERLSVLSSRTKKTDVIKLNAAINLRYKKGEEVSTREAYGDGLAALGKTDPKMVVFDAEVANSTFTEKFREAFPERFFEMFIAEQEMVSAAAGISKLGYKPFVATFAAFLTRAFDQIRMARYSSANVKITGSHSGVSIGPDGPSQMGLEDIAMFKSVSDSIILYPADAISTIKLLELAYNYNGISYLRTTRAKMPVLYSHLESFAAGGSKVLKQAETDRAVIFAAGDTLHEALRAHRLLAKLGITVAIVDLYSIKPLDEKTVNALANKVKTVIVAEDHNAFGGLGESVKMAINNTAVKFIHLAIHKIPHSASPEKQMAGQGINAEHLADIVRGL